MIVLRRLVGDLGSFIVAIQGRPSRPTLDAMKGTSTWLLEGMASAGL
jgi:hypothetical protein